MDLTLDRKDNSLVVWWMTLGAKFDRMVSLRTYVHVGQTRVLGGDKERLGRPELGIGK